MLQSRSKVRGYRSKSSLGRNCRGLTKMLTMTKGACWRAARTSDRWPSCKLPMVGTNATAPAAEQARRSDSMSFAICISAEVEEFPAALHRAQPADEQLEIGVALDEVEILGIHRQHRRRVVVVEEARVAVGEEGEVFLADAAFVAGGAAAHALGEHRGLRLQVDDKVGRRRAGTQRIVDLLIQGELVLVQRQAGEKRVLVDEEVADRRLGEKIELRQRFEHARPLEKKKQ